ncbi:MAG TPA: hypothetical protein VFE13_15865 [Caulobacteraceae bacterium]|nr:hypothetical protein [Caulobacteraceae bacterium]
MAAGPTFAAEPLAEQPGSTIGYPTAEAALAALHAKPNVEFSIQAGWTVASDPDSNSVWTFPPEHDPAYPAVVRRQATPGPNGAVSVHTDVLCAASKQACDDLVRAFERMTDEANDQARGGDAGGGVGAGE